MSPDYNVFELRFPNRSSAAMVFLNDNGSFDIYLNTLFPQEKRWAALEHELRHIFEEHFYADVSVTLAERQAEGERLNIVSHPPQGALPHFYSEQAFAHWVRNLSVQTHANIL